MLREALAKPAGTLRLREMVRPGPRVVIVTSDLTRPCLSERLLPPVLDELAAAGIPADDVTVVMALGLHRPMTEAEGDGFLDYLLNVVSNAMIDGKSATKNRQRGLAAHKQKRHRIYIDESGDHAYGDLDDPAKRYLGLTGLTERCSSAEK